MIKHHPTIDMLNAYTKGELPASLSIAINIHSQSCDECKHHIAQLTQDHATQAFNDFTEAMPNFSDSKGLNLNANHSHLASDADNESAVIDLDFDTNDEFQDMFSAITKQGDEPITAVAKKPKQKILTVKKDSYTLPSVLNNVEQGKWQI